MKQMINWFLRDLVSIIIILIFIRMLFLKRYGASAAKYMENQFGIIVTNSISLLIMLNIYYYLENIFHIDSQHTSGIILTLFFLCGGRLSKKLYKRYFYDGVSLYKADQREYLFMSVVAFVAVSIKLVAEGIIGIVVPFAILMGRFLWFDTESIQKIKEEVEVQHERIIEISVLFLGGIILIAIVMHVVKVPGEMQSLIACVYGMIIYFCVGAGRK